MIENHHLLGDVEPRGAIREAIATLRVHHPDPLESLDRERALLLDWELVLVQGEVVRYAGRRAAREDDERAGRAESRVAELGESDGGREGVEISLDVREDDAEGATVQGVVLARDGPVVRGGLVVDVVVVVAPPRRPASWLRRCRPSCPGGFASRRHARDAGIGSLVSRGGRARDARRWETRARGRARGRTRRAHTARRSRATSSRTPRASVPRRARTPEGVMNHNRFPRNSASNGINKRALAIRFVLDDRLGCPVSTWKMGASQREISRRYLHAIFSDCGTSRIG